MDGFHRHWAQAILFVGVLSAVLPFLHFDTSEGQLEHRYVTSNTVGSDAVSMDSFAPGMVAPHGSAPGRDALKPIIAVEPAPSSSSSNRNRQLEHADQLDHAKLRLLISD